MSLACINTLKTDAKKRRPKNQEKNRIAKKEPDHAEFSGTRGDAPRLLWPLMPLSIHRYSTFLGRRQLVLPGGNAKRSRRGAIALQKPAILLKDPLRLALSRPCKGHIARIALIRREIYFRRSLRVNFALPLYCEETFPGTRGRSRIRVRQAQKSAGKLEAVS